MKVDIKFLLITLFLYISSITLISQESGYRVSFYNVENLYDTINHPHTMDDDLTPEGNLRWNTYRYEAKIEALAKNIKGVGSDNLAFMGLCEVENASVLHDLTHHPLLDSLNYQTLIYPSADARGSNVALLYNSTRTNILSTEIITPHLNTLGLAWGTRDILYAKLVVDVKDTLSVFVCHFPSRSEGVKKSRPYRNACARLLRSKVDSLFSIGEQNVLVMGDFNDYPTDESMRSVLGAKNINDEFDNSSLYNLFLHRNAKEEDIASYRYRGRWGYLDQFIVSGKLLQKIKDKEGKVFAADYLLEEDEKFGGVKPHRTYSGYRYLGGASDHLPIYIDLY